MKPLLSIAVATLLVFTVLMVLTPALAAPNENASDKAKSKAGFIPEHAVKISESVYSLGNAKDHTGKVVEGFLFIDNKKSPAKPDGTPGNGNKKTKTGETSTCYSLIAKGASWKTTEPYMIGPGIDGTLTAASLDAWDSRVAFDIFGSELENENPNGADSISPDNKNEIMFENLGSTNTIAYTITWGIFSGPPSQRVLVEWDVVFNSDYAFGNAAYEMDYQNIATHEFGHALGLTHPSDTCLEETMYRFADVGEIKKRTLEPGDIAGLNKLYG
ncbi:MAG: matrixin family metalloprotease [Nitrosopumilus sp.]